MGELKLVVKNKSGEVKSGFKQTRIKGKIVKFDVDKCSKVSEVWSVRTEGLNKS